MTAVKEQKAAVDFQIKAIPEHIANEVRLTGRSPQYGHPAHTDTAKGYGPCRSCLRTFETGREERILFTYNAFEGRAELPLPGPVFIHKEECVRYEGEIFPPDLRNLPMVFEAFSAEGEMLKRVGAVEANIEVQIEDLFSISETDYIYVRNAEAGCFMAFVDRKVRV